MLSCFLSSNTATMTLTTMMFLSLTRSALLRASATEKSSFVLGLRKCPVWINYDKRRCMDMEINYSAIACRAFDGVRPSPSERWNVPKTHVHIKRCVRTTTTTIWNCILIKASTELHRKKINAADILVFGRCAVKSMVSMANVTSYFDDLLIRNWLRW